jgi:hypothetical protein
VAGLTATEKWIVSLALGPAFKIAAEKSRPFSCMRDEPLLTALPRNVKDDPVLLNLDIIGIQAADLTGSKPSNTETDKHKGIPFPSPTPAIGTIQQAFKLSAAENPWGETCLPLGRFKISGNRLFQISLIFGEPQKGPCYRRSPLDCRRTEPLTAQIIPVVEEYLRAQFSAYPGEEPPQFPLIGQPCGSGVTAALEPEKSLLERHRRNVHAAPPGNYMNASFQININSFLGY